MVPKKEDEAEKPLPVLESVRLDLPPSMAAINLAGRQYVHGQTYAVPMDVAWSLKEIMNRGWTHEASLKDPTDYSKRRSGRAFA
jgi:hypothetical protein